MTSPAQEVADLIIQGQTRVVGDAAFKLAGRVRGLKVKAGEPPQIDGSEIEVLDRLVRQYSAITGPIGARICYMSAVPVLRQHPELQIPALAEFR
jgi:hypothetical protein